MTDDGRTFDLGDGIIVRYNGAERGNVHLTFYAERDGETEELIDRDDIPFGFYDDRTARGKLRNRLLKVIGDRYDPDDVSPQIVRGGFEKMCRIFRESAPTDEDLQSEDAVRLRRETDRVTKHVREEEATVTVRFRRGRQTFDITFDHAEWASDDCSTKIRNQYQIPTDDLLRISPEEWQFLRDEWNGNINTRVVDDVTDEDEIAYELVRLLETRIAPTVDTAQLSADPKAARYDRNNDAHPDVQIREEHGDVDVLWVQTAVINDALNDIPGASPDLACKSPLGSRMGEDGTLLRGSKRITSEGLPVWAFDADVFGGRELLGEGDGDDDEDDDTTRTVGL